MTFASVRRAAVAALVLVPVARSAALSQVVRARPAEIGATTRVLLIGTRPEDEDNGLIAWLSLGRNIETAYLSLTRGESAVNLAGTERQSALAVVRTAELLAERERDGAHQYFTRAYDFGPTQSDSLTNALWPHDSLLRDVVSVVRAFRPHVIISVFSDGTERDVTRRVTARLAAEAFSAAADSVVLPSRATSRLPVWRVSRLLTRVDSAGASATGSITIDVGEFDRGSGRSYAEIGADIRKLQRSQPPQTAPPVGHVLRTLRLDSTRVGTDRSPLFGDLDTTWSRFRGAVSPDVQTVLDSLVLDLRAVRTLQRSGSADSLAVVLARAAMHATNVRRGFPCSDVSGVPACSDALADLAMAVNTVRERAPRAFLSAAGVVIDGTVERELVAAGDSVPVNVSVFNGGKTPLTVRRLAADSRSALVTFVRDTAVIIAPDSVSRWTGSVRVRGSSLHWWQVNGLVTGTALHAFETLSRNPVIPQLISGEDRIPNSGVEATLSVAGIDVPLIERPLVYRSSDAVRGDARHPLAGVTPMSVLLEKTAEYERASLPIDRLFRVFLSSSRIAPETLAVTIQLPPGLKADSARRTVILPALGSRNVFFRLRGTLPPFSDSVFAIAEPVSATTPVNATTPVRIFSTHAYNYGVITHDYPHIPSQQFIRSSKERLEVVDLRVPPRLRVAYVKGNDDVQAPLGQLQVNLQALDPSLLSVVDLSWYTTIVIGADAFANDALIGAVPSLHEFMRNGGTVVVLPGKDEIARSGLLPFPITFDSTPGRVGDPDAVVRVTDIKSQLLTWPNVITAKDFAKWSGERGRNIPSTFDPRYKTLLMTGDAGETQTAATLLVAPVGRGVIVYTSLSLDRQLAAVNAGAARLFVNLLSAGLKPGAGSAR
jgi:LmbE family N-acetylglucosaminyl deacetylase